VNGNLTNGLAGYFQQAPALEAIASVNYKSEGWTPIGTLMNNGKTRIDFSPEEETAFLAWCGRNVRYGWVPIEVDPILAKQKLSQDERRLIEIHRPLLNVKHCRNGFVPFLTEARKGFREESKCAL
jgi:hypothetical protein